MKRPNGNHEDRANKSDLKIPPVASSFERRMREYMAAQTHTLQAMAQTKANIHQHITEQPSFLMNNNSISSDNHPIPTDLPPFDKEKLLAMQARVLQGKLQSKTSTSDNMEMTRAEVPTGPVKRQVAEAWNNEKRKRNYEAPKPLREEQHEISKTPGMCQCCEH